MFQFIRDNFYPVLKKLDNNYLTKLEKTERILMLAVLNKRNVEHITFLESFFLNLALQRRDFVFSYIDTQEDKYLMQFFNISDDVRIRIIAYNFQIGKYYIDEYKYNKNNESFDRLNEILKNIDQGSLTWSTGYAIEDNLNRLGFNLSRETIILLFFFFLTVSLGIILVAICQSIEKRKAVKIKTN
jgi:hypothetical protein